jgi:hypothetical protein
MMSAVWHGRLARLRFSRCRVGTAGGDIVGARTIQINRAPVLTLWAAVVAERLGFDEDEALSLGKALAGLNAQAKGRRLGIFKPAEAGARKAWEMKRGEEFWVDLCGRPVPARNTDEGVRAVSGAKVVDSPSARRYLDTKFGPDLAAVRDAMRRLAAALKPQDLADRAFGLYEAFRPEIPPGVRGWGAKGVLDLQRLLALADDG